MERGTLPSVPLALLFPETPVADLELIRAAGAGLDRARSGFGTTWEWAPRHATFPDPPVAGIPGILLVATVVESAGSDWLEFDLDVQWTRQGRLQVVAAVNVACWCATNHNTHYVDKLVLTIDPGASLGRAFETASRLMITWLEDPHTADWWRAKARLPSRERGA